MSDAVDAADPAAVVRRFCDAWASFDLDTIVGFFTDDATYHNIPIAPVYGRDAIRATIDSFTGGTSSIEFKVLNLAVDGATVLTERVDVFTFPSTVIELPVMGTFEIVAGRIAAWRDYFDLNQFMSQLPGAARG
jgi:limonene-1,2-epoxide hydrolase